MKFNTDEIQFIHVGIRC